MDNGTAVKTINGLRFMPGWRFDAYDFTNGQGDTIMARALIDTVNSDQDKAKQGYPQKITLERSIMLRPESYEDSDQLAAALFQWIMEILIHESREFLRYSTEDHRAPLHPHRPEGEALWRDTVTNPTGPDPMRGLFILNV